MGVCSTENADMGVALGCGFLNVRFGSPRSKVTLDNVNQQSLSLKCR
jgi:hypothetical protein